MAELKCKDGTVIKISDETEAELRKAFSPKPKDYIDGSITVKCDNHPSYPIEISTDGDEKATVSRDVEDVEALIVALQKVVTYCKQNNLGD